MRYTLGIIAGLCIGILYSSASLIQKSAVAKADHSKPLMRQLVRNPLWILSVLVSGVFVLMLTLVGQMLIGPTLIPGLAAIGMIIIPIGASKFIGEKNGLKEYLGITGIIIGVILLSLSKLSINTEEVAWMEAAFFRKSMWYFGGLSGASVLCLVIGICIKKRFPITTATLYSLSGGILYGLSNLLAAPISSEIRVFSENGIGEVNLAYLIISGLYLLLINVYAVSITQKAFALGNVSMLVPVQQVPIQIIPIFSHFWFFSGTFPSLYSKIGVPTAVILILLGAAALGNKGE